MQINNLNGKLRGISLRVSIAALAVFAFSTVNAAKKTARGFAIVIDRQTYDNVRNEVDAYAQAVLTYENLKTYMVVDRTGIPDSIRATLRSLHEQKDCPIEGAVLIGDIPIAMIRDAQHLTSAFKMDQDNFPWEESSVPSDRFYDDFGLDFRFIKRDSANANYFYYSLLASSRQYLAPDIYIGRIRANDEFGTTKYYKIARYLRKAVAQKKEQNYLDRIMFFSGHGYVSGSLDARMDEKIAMFDNFPWLRDQVNGVEYIDHQRANPIKDRVKSELQRPELDLAIMHHHGDTEIQYFNSERDPQSMREAIEAIKGSVRAVLRHYKKRGGQNIDSMRNVLSLRYDSIPYSWFDKAFDREIIEADSLDERSLNLYYDEFADYNPQARLVILDACYNGSFHKEKNIAGGYIFGTGNTVVAIGNSVNVLQDKWCDRYIGMVALGMRAGRMLQLNPFLEGHLIGDPTFRFTPKECGFDADEAVAAGSLSFWKKQLSSKSSAVRCMALRKLVDLDRRNASATLLEHYKKSTSGPERLEALILLSTYNNADFLECLRLGVNDGYEMAQRFAVKYIARVGDLSLVPALVDVCSRNNTSERIEFNAKEAIQLFPKESLTDAFENHWKNVRNYYQQQKVHDDILHALEVCANKWEKETATVYDDSSSVRRKLMNVRYLRNNQKHAHVSQLLDYVQRCPDEKVQITLLETLGWFDLSYRRSEISAVVKKMSEDGKYPQPVRDEALKTYNRLNKKY